MKRIPGTNRLKALLFTIGLAAAGAASPLLAQQQFTQPAPPLATEAPALASEAPTAPLSGPRVRAEQRPIEAPAYGTSTTATRHSNQTITVSTLVLVLAVIILVLLIA